MSSIFVGRQPIYDRDLGLYAYELLFRDGTVAAARVIDGDAATSAVMINAFLDFGLEILVGDAHAFINLTRSFLTGEQPIPVPPGRVVLEVLEDVVPDAAVIEAVKQLVARGYTIALDDFSYRPEYRPLVQLAHIIKVDLLAVPEAQWGAQAAAIRADNPRVRLLAEKVETREAFARCLELGFDFFQGYFLSRPDLVRGRGHTASNRAVVLNLLTRIRDPDTSFGELEAVLVHDAPLTYRLLRYANSAASGLRAKVDSVKRALMLIGLETVRNWASVILLSRVEDKPLSLIETALVRAKMCEALASARRAPNREQYFTAGLFSLMDALLDTPLPQLLDEVKMGEELRGALLEYAGPIGQVLGEVLDYECGRWDELLATDFPPAVYRAAFLDALAWAQSSAELLRPGETQEGR